MAQRSRFNEDERVGHRPADPSTREWASGGKFWNAWQSAVAIMGVPLIAWMYLAPSDLQLTPGWYLISWLGIFLIATVAGEIRRRF